MKDDCSAVNEPGENWYQRFERVMWLKSAGDYEGAEMLLQKLADESGSREERALSLLWLTEVNGSYHFESPRYAKKLLKLSMQVVNLLYGGHTDLQQQPNHLLMRAFLLMSQAQYRLGNYRESIFALTQAAGCMTPADSEALRRTTRVIALTIQCEDSWEAEAKERKNLWNCEKRHEGPEDCAADKTCPGPNLIDQQNWIRNFWSCPNDHLPDECHYGKCEGPCQYTPHVWEQMQPLWEIIDRR